MNQSEIIKAPKVIARTPSGIIGKPFTGGASFNNYMEAQEIWKDVPGFENIYEISSHGRLKSYKKDPNGFILSNINKKGGYLSIVLKYQGKIKYIRIHTLMVLVFWGIKTNHYIQIHHLDENKQHNLLSNFEILTSHDHSVISIRNNPKRMDGINNYNKYIKTNPILQYDLDGNFIKEFFNGKDASDKTGICHRNILQVASKAEYKPGLTRKQAGGFIWKFKEAKNVLTGIVI